MCATSDYLEELLLEIKEGGRDLGLVVLTIEDVDDGSAVELHSNLSEADTNHIMTQMTGIEITAPTRLN